MKAPSPALLGSLGTYMHALDETNEYECVEGECFRVLQGGSGWDLSCKGS